MFNLSFSQIFKAISDMHPQRRVLYLLAFIVATSKQIIIYNEELLVTLAFYSFVFFIGKNYGDELTESLFSRSNELQKDIEVGLSEKSGGLSSTWVQNSQSFGFKNQMPSFVKKVGADLEKLGHFRRSGVIPSILDESEGELSLVGKHTIAGSSVVSSHSAFEELVLQKSGLGESCFGSKRSWQYGIGEISPKKSKK
uniref:ATP synthase F0 subunit beta n=1 Tax=Chloropicon sp. RCC4434 TaxID=2565277 RepID=A0A4D6C566_9CHLO|nr:ATP synthase F0 subunit beta [Chloropicon sp. RCC4434]